MSKKEKKRLKKRKERAKNHAINKHCDRHLIRREDYEKELKIDQELRGMCY